MVMEQFDKWFAKSTIRDIRKPYCRDSWKAALKWVLERENELKPDEWDFIDVCEAIKKELRMTKANPEGMKWPTNKDKYDKNYLRLYGKQCPVCGGWGVYEGTETTCEDCNGLGYVKKSKCFWTKEEEKK